MMVENVIQIKSGVMINVEASAKIREKMCAKNIIFGILLYLLVKLVYIYKVLFVIQ